MHSVAGIVWRGLQIALACGIVAWIVLAVHFQVPVPLIYPVYLILALWSAGLAILAARRRWGRLWGAMAASLALWAAWWVTIAPRAERDWMAEVSRGVTGEPLEGGLIRVRNIRDFRWSSPTEAEEAWYDLDVDPRAIRSVDMVLSVWDRPDIAHTLVSFGFAEGRHIVFSGEIRKEVGEEFSTIGGFFKRYELVLIAADERDIVHLRTDARGEQVSLFPIEIDPELRARLFLAFVERANALAERPQWYHTLWTNCTTLPFQIVRRLSDGVPLDLRIILSGRLPGYLHDLGVLPGAGRVPLDELTRRAVLLPRPIDGLDSEAYSRLLRQAWQEN